MSPLLLKLASLVKTADDKGDQFNEQIPSQEEETENGEKPVINKQEGQQPEGEAQVEPEGEVVEEPMPEETPEDYGARAAQAFLGPDVFNAAMQGDQMAIDLIARTAGQIAATVSQNAANEMANGANGEAAPVTEGEVDEYGNPINGEAQPVGEELAAPAVATPEEEIANQIVAEPVPTGAPPNGPVNATPASAGKVPGETQQQPQQQPIAEESIQPTATGPNGEPLYDEATIDKIIALVKAGKL